MVHIYRRTDIPNRICNFNITMKTLTKKELKEPMFITWGRLRTAIKENKDLERASLLIDKFQQDLDKSVEANKILF